MRNMSPSKKNTRATLAHRVPRRVRDGDDVRAVRELALVGVAARDVLGHAGLDQPLHRRGAIGAPCVRSDLRQRIRQLAERGARCRDRVGQVLLGGTRQVPARHRGDEPVDPFEQVVRRLGVEVPDERLDRLPALHGAGHVARDAIGARHVRRGRARLRR